MGGPARRRGAGLSPARAAPASRPASSPASPGPLSGSRAAAHMVPCQIPSGSGGHVSGSWQLSQPRVTMETAANGRPAQSAGAEPSEAGAGGRGRVTRAGPWTVRSAVPWLLSPRPEPRSLGHFLPPFPRHSWVFSACRYKAKVLESSRPGFRSYRKHRAGCHLLN